MASELEHNTLRLAFSGTLLPEHLDELDDYVFATLMAENAMNSIDFDEPGAADTVILWLSEYDRRGFMISRLQTYRAKNRESRVKEFAEDLFSRLTEPVARQEVLRIFWDIIALKETDLSQEERKIYALKSKENWDLKSYLKAFGFDADIVQVFIDEERSLNYVPEAMFEEACALLDTEALSDEIFENAWNKAKLMPHLPLLSIEKVLTAIKEIKDFENLSAAIEALKLCKDEFKNLAEKFEEAMVRAKPMPGRPAAEDAARLKTLRSAAKRDSNYYRDQLNYLELDILAYELTLQAQEASLARAIKAEESGNVTDPLKVSVLEDTIQKVKEHIRFKAVYEVIVQLQEAEENR